MSLKFDTDGDHISRVSNLLDYNNPYTTSFWVLTSADADDYAYLYSNSGSTTLTTWQNGYDGLGLYSNGTQLRSFVANGAGNYSEVLGSHLTVGKWHHIAIVRESSTSFKVYLDGVLDIINTQDTSGRSAAAKEYFGMFYADYNTHIGSVAALKQWNAALSLGEIQAESRIFSPLRRDSFHSGIPMFHSSLSGCLLDIYSGAHKDWTDNGTMVVGENPPILHKPSKARRSILSVGSISLDGQELFSRGVVASLLTEIVCGSTAHIGCVLQVNLFDGIIVPNGVVFTTAISGSLYVATVVYDDFERADGGLGINWINSYDASTLSIVGGDVPTLTAAIADAVWKTDRFSNNQFSEVVVATPPSGAGGYIAVWVRRQPERIQLSTEQQGYVARYYNGNIELYVYDGAWNLLSTISQSSQIGDRLRLYVSGISPVRLEVYHNGVLKIDYSDSTYKKTGGNPGIIVWSNSAPNGAIESWRGGSGDGVDIEDVPVAPWVRVDADKMYMTGYSVANSVISLRSFSDYNAVTGQLARSMRVRVLEPTSPAPGMPHRFLYALPVQGGEQTTYGDGLETLRQLDVHNDYNCTIIAPDFENEPWYADHPTDLTCRYDSYMVQELKAWVESNYGFGDEHWLIGFSKSGYGALTLIMRHTSVFDRVAVWDFPADMDYGRYSPYNYGNNQHFEDNYRLKQSFIDAYGADFQSTYRLWISGDDSVFEVEVVNFADRCDLAGVIYLYSNEGVRAHTWDSGWVPTAIAALHSMDSSLDGPVTIQASLVTVVALSTQIGCVGQINSSILLTGNLETEIFYGGVVSFAFMGATGLVTQIGYNGQLSHQVSLAVDVETGILIQSQIGIGQYIGIDLVVSSDVVFTGQADYGVSLFTDIETAIVMQSQIAGDLTSVCDLVVSNDIVLDSQVNYVVVLSVSFETGSDLRGVVVGVVCSIQLSISTEMHIYGQDAYRVSLTSSIFTEILIIGQIFTECGIGVELVDAGPSLLSTAMTLKLVNSSDLSTFIGLSGIVPFNAAIFGDMSTQTVFAAAGSFTQQSSGSLLTALQCGGGVLVNMLIGGELFVGIITPVIKTVRVVVKPIHYIDAVMGN